MPNFAILILATRIGSIYLLRQNLLHKLIFGFFGFVQGFFVVWKYSHVAQLIVSKSLNCRGIILINKGCFSGSYGLICGRLILIQIKLTLVVLFKLIWILNKTAFLFKSWNAFNILGGYGRIWSIYHGLSLWYMWHSDCLDHSTGLVQLIIIWGVCRLLYWLLELVSVLIFCRQRS